MKTMDTLDLLDMKSVHTEVSNMGDRTRSIGGSVGDSVAFVVPKSSEHYLQ